MAARRLGCADASCGPASAGALAAFAHAYPCCRGRWPKSPPALFLTCADVCGGDHGGGARLRRPVPPASCTSSRAVGRLFKRVVAAINRRLGCRAGLWAPASLVLGTTSPLLLSVLRW